MKTTMLFICVCLFIGCKHANKLQISGDDVSGQVIAFDTLNGYCDCRSVSPAASTDTYENSGYDDYDTIVSYNDSDYDEYDEYVNALHGTAILRDTLIPISKGFAILYTEYNEKLELWYKLHIVNLNKKDTVKVAPLYDDDDDSELGSELWHEVSPNLRYVMVQRIIKGFVIPGIDGPEPSLHETYSCMIVDMEKAKAIVQVDKFICGWEHIDDEEYKR
jgi:hypothetical protein